MLNTLLHPHLHTPELSCMGRPAYVVSETLLRRNLSLIASVAKQAQADIILAFKAYALWKTFSVFREYIAATTASSLYEARLAAEEFGSAPHTYSPAYTDTDIDDIARLSSHLTFNSLSQYERYAQRALHTNPGLSLGLRINPRSSPVETLLYNPCAPGTRFGIDADSMPANLPPHIEGFHCHTLCESSAAQFAEVLSVVERDFARWLPQLQWMNFGGGHLMTREGYDVPMLVRLLQDFRQRHPNLHIILEPGSAFAWQTGWLVAHVVDIVCDQDITTAVLDVSFTCHMPDCLEMPYQPEVWVKGEKGKRREEPSAAEDQREKEAASGFTYRLGGNSCLSGDFIGTWTFASPLHVGDTIVFEDMAHYTTVKTNMFNGVHHPSLLLLTDEGTLKPLRHYGYEDYRDRMD